MSAKRARRSIALFALALLVVSCTSGKQKGSALPGTPRSVTPPAVRLTPGQSAHHIRVSFQYGAFEVTVGDAVYDKTSEKLFVGIRYRNLTTGWRQASSEGALRFGDTERSMFEDRIVDVPPAMSADSTAVIDSLKDDPGESSTIVWGGRDRNRVTFTLGGVATDGVWLPADLALDGWGRIGKYAVHVNRGQILAASLGTGFQAPARERVLRLYFDEYATRFNINGFFPDEHLTLKLPSGKIVESIRTSEPLNPVSWSSTSGNWIDFPIPMALSGTYSLLFSSVSTRGLGLRRPKLIERIPIPFQIGDVKPGAPGDGDPPQPVLPGTNPPGVAIDRPLDVGIVDVGGFLFNPSRLRWDPSTKKATVHGTATYIQTVIRQSPGLSGGALSLEPDFNFNALLATDATFYSGRATGSTELPGGKPRDITFEFSDVRHLDPDAAALLFGSGSTAASSVPLGRLATIAAYPPKITELPVASPKATAGNWTVQLRRFRVGMLRTSPRAIAGHLQVEIFFDVTASKAAKAGTFGLTFSPKDQLFISNPDGYLQQAVGDSGSLEFKPGETRHQSVTFDVLDAFHPGRSAFVVRSADELDLVHRFIETTFAATLGSSSLPGQTDVTE